MKSVTGTQSVSLYYGQPVYGQLGLKTIYCEGMVVCPWWVTGAMDGTLNRSPLGSDSSDKKAKPSSSESLYISYEPLAAGTKVDRAAVAKQQQHIKNLDHAAAK